VISDALSLLDLAGEKFAIGTLNKKNCPQFSVDFTLATDQINISHTGDSDVFVSGYRTTSLLGYGDDDEFGDGGFSTDGQSLVSLLNSLP